MPLITFQPSGKSVNIEAGTALLDAARQAGVALQSPCGGEGACGDCAVRLISGEVQSVDTGVLSPEQVEQGYVLACSSLVKDAPLEVQVPEQITPRRGAFAEDLIDASRLRQELVPRKEDLEPLTERLALTVPEAAEQPGLSDAGRLTNAIRKHHPTIEIEYPLEVIRSLAGALRAEAGRVALTLARDPDRLRLIQIEPGSLAADHLGLAVDLGTTTVAVQLVSLPGGEVLATETDYNDQIECGADIIGRINYARAPGRLEELRQRVLGTIERLLRRACDKSGARPQRIVNAHLSGNTTMTHLLLGLDPEYIRLSPYTPTVYEPPRLTAAEVGLSIHPLAPVSISPAVGSYVGGDITAGLLCTDLAYGIDDAVHLFMDIGTNGELVAGNRDFLTACACSAGPAFEGGGIRCGMRAVQGAIDHVDIDRETGRARFRTVGNAAPQGICGSGMVSLLAGLFLSGWIDAAGKLERARTSPVIRVQGRRASYAIAFGEQTGSGKSICIDETEIQSLIRAKAAVYSACSLMLEQIGIGFQDLAFISIAGGFGRFLDIDSARAIGLLPDLPRQRFRYLGNASLLGTRMALVSARHRRLQLAASRRITYLELNTDPAYMDQYTGALFLPHTDLQRFPTVEKALRGR